MTLFQQAQDESTAAGILESLARSDNPTIREMTMSNPSAPEKAWEGVENDEVWWVRLAAAQNPNAPAEALTRLSADPVDVVRQSVAQHRNVPSKTLTVLTTDTRSEVRGSAKAMVRAAG